MSEVVRLQPLVRARVAALGEPGRAWHAHLPTVLAELAEEWSLVLGRGLPGGSASYVLGARTAAGARVVVKVALADPGFDAEVEALRRADGRGHARLLAHDRRRGAALLEHLGPALGASGLAVEQQLDALVATLGVAWWVPDRPLPDPSLPNARSTDARSTDAPPTHRASVLAAGIVARRDLARPEERPAVEQALAYAAELGDPGPDDLVLAHGDPHPGNLLRVVAPRPGAETGWCFVDPIPCVTERAHDLGVAVRDFSRTLLAEPTTAAARLRSWCARVAEPSGVDPARVWAWGFLARVSTGLDVRSFGAPAVADPFLRSAHLLAAAGPPGRASNC